MQSDGYFVPDARMMDMMRALDKKVIAIETESK